MPKLNFLAETVPEI